VQVGPGTGVAPMRAFLQDRDVQCQGEAAGSTAVGPACLFFGCRKADGDCLYAAEWATWTKPGRVLASRGGLGGLFVACSQDQPKKLYVTHRLEEHGAAVWALLDQGAWRLAG
jgi:sulfite reductase alpha subunit-like flavoprotein